MRIQESVVGLSGFSEKTRTVKKEETLKIIKNQANPESAGQTSGVTNKDIISIQNLMSESKVSDISLKEINQTSLDEIHISDRDKQKLILLQKMIEHMTGKKFKFYFLDMHKMLKSKENYSPETVRNNSANELPIRIEYHFSEKHKETEKVMFRGAGIVKTEDGREINFNINMNLSRETVRELNIDIGVGKEVDPLVINFDSTHAKLEGKEISFDLDMDKKEDKIRLASNGSGYLALDKNSDGKINDGSELFGPTAGNGFQELMQYDEDNNNWIDENDPVYDKLRIWTEDENGNEKLFALGEKGIGAIFLGNVDTVFGINDSEGNNKGIMKKTGVFLHESGKAGTVQHIDLLL